MQDYDIIKKLMDRYCCNMEKFAMMKRNGEYTTPKRALTFQDIWKHLHGIFTVSVFGKQYHTCFACFDVDEDNKPAVARIIDKLAEIGIPRNKIYPSTSGNKGYHVDLYFDHLVFKSFIGNLAGYLRRDPELAGVNFEYFPVGAKGVKMPLGYNFKTGRRCWYLDRDTLEPIENEEYVLEVEKITAAEFEADMHKLNKELKVADIQQALAMQAEWHEKNKDETKTEKKPSYSKYSSHDLVLTRSGERHDKMLKKSVWLRTVGADEQTIFDELMKWVDRQDQSLINSSRKEIEDDAWDMAKSAVKNYEPRVEWKPQRQGVCFPKRITEGNLRNILCGGTPAARKVAMLICLYTKRFGSAKLSMARMAEILGLSMPTIQKAVADLVEKKVILLNKKGGMKRINGEPRLISSEYSFNEAVVVGNKYLDTVATVDYVFDDVKDDVVGFYYRTVFEMVPPDRLHEFVSRRDIEKYQGLLKGGGGDPASDGDDG